MNKDLFYFDQGKNVKRQVPLADRIRPKTLDEFVGQEDIVGEGKILRKMMEEDKISLSSLLGSSRFGKNNFSLYYCSSY